MNLPLHFGWLGVFEAALIAVIVGMLCFMFWRWLCKLTGWGEARAIGWACVSAVAISAGVDSWNLFYMGVVKLESPLYARIALSKMHDPDFLGTRVFLEWAGAVSGVVLGWALFRDRGARERVEP